MTDTREGALIGAVDPPLLHVMSFNIRRRLPAPFSMGRDRWSGRAPLVATLLQAERPSIVGLQEVMPDQARLVQAALGTGYRLLGRGREADGRGEGCPLLVDERRLEILDWEQLALSDHPRDPGSRTWGNPFSRAVVCATLRDRVTGAKLFAVNTHLDPISRRSRIRSAEMVAELIVEAALPAVLTGDMNTGPDSEPLGVLADRAQLRDAWSEAERRLTPEWATNPSYGTLRTRGRSKRIDLIAVSPGVRVESVAINPWSKEQRRPSDHLPVQATITIQPVGMSE